MATYLHLRQQQLIYLLHPTYLACSFTATIICLPHPTYLAYICASLHLRQRLELQYMNMQQGVDLLP